MAQTEQERRAEIKRKVLARARDLQIPEELVDSLVTQESAWNPLAKARTTSAKGLFQVTDAAAKDVGMFGQDMYDPDINAQAGLTYLRRLYDRAGSWPAALQHYYAGANQSDPTVVREGQQYASEILGRTGMAGPPAGNGMDGDISQMFGMLPNLQGIMRWITAGGGEDPGWGDLSRQATVAERDDLRTLHRAEQGLSTEAIEEQFRATQPSAAGDFVNRMFSNVASALTGSPLFAQAAEGSIQQRDATRRQEILRKNIAAYERAAAEYEKSGNYSKAVKMRRLEYAERERMSSMETKAGLSGIALKEFGEIQATMLRAGISMDKNGQLKVLTKPTNTFGRMKAEDWTRRMIELQTALTTAAGLKKDNERRHPEVMANLKSVWNAHVSTPVEGQTAEQLQRQIEAYASEDLDDKERGALFRAALLANQDLPGAEPYLQVIRDLQQAEEDAKKGSTPPPPAPGVRTPSRQGAIPMHTQGALPKQEPSKYVQPFSDAASILASTHLDAIRSTLTGLGVEEGNVDEAMKAFGMRMNAVAMAETLKVAEKIKQAQERKKEKEQAKAERAK